MYSSRPTNTGHTCYAALLPLPPLPLIQYVIRISNSRCALFEQARLRRTCPRRRCLYYCALTVRRWTCSWHDTCHVYLQQKTVADPFMQAKLAEDLSNSRAIDNLLRDVFTGLQVCILSFCELILPPPTIYIRTPNHSSISCPMPIWMSIYCSGSLYHRHG